MSAATDRGKLDAMMDALADVGLVSVTGFPASFKEDRRRFQASLGACAAVSAAARGRGGPPVSASPRPRSAADAPPFAGRPFAQPRDPPLLRSSPSSPSSLQWRPTPSRAPAASRRSPTGTPRARRPARPSMRPPRPFALAWTRSRAPSPPASRRPPRPPRRPPQDGGRARLRHLRRRGGQR